MGRVSAGNGVPVYEDIIGYELCESKYLEKDYFFLEVNGDSMSPFINDKDIVFVRKQTSVDSGSIAVVAIDEEDGLVKKVIYSKEFIELHSFNPAYEIRRFEGKDVLRVRVLGQVIESKKKWV